VEKREAAAQPPPRTQICSRTATGRHATDHNVNAHALALGRIAQWSCISQQSLMRVMRIDVQTFHRNTNARQHISFFQTSILTPLQYYVRTQTLSRHSISQKHGDIDEFVLAQELRIREMKTSRLSECHNLDARPPHPGRVDNRPDLF
jgi:hypothetical protein